MDDRVKTPKKNGAILELIEKSTPDSAPGHPGSQDNLNRIFMDLYNDRKLVETDDFSDYIDRVKSVYSDGKFSYLISNISTLIIGLYDQSPERFEMFTINLNKLNDTIRKTDGCNEIAAFFERLYEDFKVQTTTLAYIVGMKKKIEFFTFDADERIRRINKKTKTLEEFQTQFNKKVDDKLGALLTQSVTILGIFAAFVFVFTGGFDILGHMADSLNTPFRCRYLLSLLITGFVMYNTIFGLIYCISKISGRSMAATCRFKDKRSRDCPCSKNCWQIRRLFHNYPFFFWVNVVILFAMAAVFILWLMHKALGFV